MDMYKEKPPEKGGFSLFGFLLMTGEWLVWKVKR